MTITVDDFWYDTPRHDGGRWVLGLVVHTEGMFSFRLCLSEPEMRLILDELNHDGRDGSDNAHLKTAVHSNMPSTVRLPFNLAWWDYGCIIPKDDDDDPRQYALRETAVEDVPIMLYRDDHFCVTLPHQVGLDIMEIIEQRLAVIGEEVSKVA